MLKRGLIPLFCILLSTFSYSMVFPGASWETRTPESQGVNPTNLNNALNYFDANSNGVGTDEMVIVRNGYIIWEGPDSDVKHTIHSGTKTFTTTVLGILIQEGVISSINDNAVDYYPSLDDTYTTYSGLTLKHLATFTSGYNADTTATADMKWGDPRKFLTPLAPLADPGYRWQYRDCAIHMLGHILQTASGEYLEDIYKTHIADNIGMSNWEWKHYGYSDDGSGTEIVAYFLNPSGIYGGGIHTTPLELARHGLLYLNQGNWDGNQILDSEFAQDAITNQVPLSTPTYFNFDKRGQWGYMWWTNGIGTNGLRKWPNAPPGAATLLGGSKDYCFVIPEWDMVITRMSPPGQGDMSDFGYTVWDGFFFRLKDGISDPAQEVTGLTLVNSETDQDMGPLDDGDTINIALTPNLNIRANTDPVTVGSVRFGLDSNPNYRTENGAPYALAGDDSGDYNDWTPSIGSHTVTATPYTGSDATGTAGTALTVDFDVTSSAEPVINGAMRAWQPVTISFFGPAASESDNSPNPFLDYRLQVTFTGPGSQTYNVPGYFDGNGNGGGTGNVWRVRFTPDQAGTWSYQASFRQGANVAISTSASAGSATSFDGTSGSFSITSRESSAPGFLSKGRLSYDNRYFLKTLGDNKHWIKGGTDSPENFLGYDGFDSTPASHDYSPHITDWQSGDPDWGAQDGRGIIGALNYLATRRVNSIYVLLMNIGGDGQDVWPFRGSINPAGSSSNDNTHFDISKLYQWEMVFSHAQEKGINLNLVLNEGEQANKQELDNAQLGTERKLYYREMIGRFGHHNALQWMLCEEYNHGDLAISPTMIKSWAQYISDVDPYDHPTSVHNAGENGWDPFFGDNRFDLTSYQYYPGYGGSVLSYGDKVEQLRTKASAEARPIAIGMDEFWRLKQVDDQSHSTTWPYYSGQSFLRKNALWPIYFSGGMVEYLTEDGLDTEDFSPYAKMWDYTWYARKFMEDNIPFWEMQPMDHLLTGEGSGYDEDGQVLAKPGEVYAVYLPDASPSGSFDLSGASGSFSKRWYNPRTGNFEGGTSTITGGSSLALGAPPSSSNEDWVVLLEQAGGPVVGELIGWWTMDSISGNTVLDSSDLGNDADTIAPTTVPGRIGQAIDLDGSDYLQVTDDPSLDLGTGDFTISMWIKRDRTGTREDLLTKKDVTENTHDLSFFINNADRLQLFMWSTGGSYSSVTTSSSIGTGWTHVAAIRDGGSIQLYLDAQPSGSGSLAYGISSNGPLRIGSNRLDGTTGDGAATHHFMGLVDDVRLYNKALSQSEIDDLYCISNHELMDIIELWKQDLYSIADMMDAIAIWKGCSG